MRAPHDPNCRRDLIAETRLRYRRLRSLNRGIGRGEAEFEAGPGLSIKDVLAQCIHCQLPDADRAEGPAAWPPRALSGIWQRDVCDLEPRAGAEFLDALLGARDRAPSDYEGLNWYEIQAMLQESHERRLQEMRHAPLGQPAGDLGVTRGFWYWATGPARYAAAEAQISGLLRRRRRRARLPAQPAGSVRTRPC